MRIKDKTIDFYEYYVCPKCFNRIQNCKCEFLPLELICIDKNIQEHIRLLNEKGYYTRGCCESHEDNKILGIVFYERYAFDNIPEGFKYKKELLNYDFKEKNLEKYNIKKEQILELLLEWIKALPARKQALNRQE